MEEFEEFLGAVIKPFKRDDTLLKPTRRINCIFEDFNNRGQFDFKIHKDWCFHAPYTGRITTTQLHIIVRETMPSLLQSQKTMGVTLSTISDKINAVKTALVREETAREEDLLYYVAVLRYIMRTFDNNSDSYNYRIPVDHPSEKTKDDLSENQALYFNSDKFIFEYFNVLMILLAKYNRLALQDSEKTGNSPSIENNKLRHSYYTRCCEILREMGRLLPSKEEKQSKRLYYRASPKSISNTDPQLSLQPEPLSEENAFEFLVNYSELYLGGTSQINARIHLCEAKKNEIFFDNFSVDPTRNRDDPMKLVVPVLASIIEEYEKAQACLTGVSQASKIWQYTCFMANFWLCKTHYLIAHSESLQFLNKEREAEENGSDEENQLTETDPIVKSACKALQRLDFIVEKCKEMDSLLDGQIIILDDELKHSREAYVSGINALFKTLDTKLSRERRIRVGKLSAKDTHLEVRVYQKRPENAGLFDENIKRVISASPVFMSELNTLDVLYQLYNNQGLPSQNTTTFESREKEVVVAINNQENSDSFYRNIVDTDNSLKNAYFYGILKERRDFLDTLLKSFSEDGECLLDLSHRKRFREELSRANRKISEFDSLYSV